MLFINTLKYWGVLTFITLFYICFSLWAGISVYLPCLKYFQCFLFQKKNCLIWCPIVYMSMHLFILVLEARLHYRLLRYIVWWMADLYMNKVRRITFAKLINKNIFLERFTWFFTHSMLFHHFHDWFREFLESNPPSCLFVFSLILL